MIPLDTLHCNGVEILTHKHTHVLPYDGGDVIDGLAHLAEVPAVYTPHQHTQQGDVETKDGRLRERLDPEHVQDAGEEIGDGHHGEEDGQRVCCRFSSQRSFRIPRSAAAVFPCTVS